MFYVPAAISCFETDFRTPLTGRGNTLRAAYCRAVIRNLTCIVRCFVNELLAAKQLHELLTLTFPGKMHGVVTSCCKLGKCIVV